MNKPITTIVNLETGEIVTREMNKSEYESLVEIQKEAQELDLELQAKAAARQSALEKLAALGLTEAEIQALAG
jgi:hypothetical protein